VRETAVAAAFRARPVEFLRVIPLLVRLLQKERSFESATTDALRASEGNRRARHQDGLFRFGDEECRSYEARRRAGRFAGAAF
jgi:hypothetical protein